MAIEPLFSQPFDAPPPASTSRDVLYTYLETASFVLFLIDQYGLERFQRLYRVSLVPIPNFGEAFCRIYDEEIAYVERDWLEFLAGYAVGQEARARRFVQATFDFFDRVVCSLNELEEYWGKFAFELVSPSEKVSNEYGILTSLLTTLGCFSEQGMTCDEADEAYEAFERTLTAVESLSTTWLEAIHTFEDVLGSIVMAEVDNYGFLIARLEEAWERYQHVGDEGMVERVGKFIAALQCLVQGTDAFASDAPEAAEGLLLKAASLFAELGRPEMVNKVDHLLEVYRCVTP